MKNYLFVTTLLAVIFMSGFAFADACMTKCPDGLVKFGENTCSNGVCTDCNVDCTGHMTPAVVAQPPAPPAQETQQPVQTASGTATYTQPAGTGMATGSPAGISMETIYLVVMILVIISAFAYYIKTRKQEKLFSRTLDKKYFS
jgi:hypothetical protein